MMYQQGSEQAVAARLGSWSRETLALSLVVLLGMMAVVALARWMERYRPANDAEMVAEELYLTPQSAKRLSLGFNGLVADWYWMRALQYVGRKVMNHSGDIQLDDLSQLNLKLIAPLLEATTTLDPQFTAAYEYGATVLPAVDIEAAIKLVQKGVVANPDKWRLRHYLGYIYWQQGRYAEAKEAYLDGSRVAGSPRWMTAMAARMEAEGGGRTVAREMYRAMYEQADDEQIKLMALKRLLQLRSMDERDTIRRVLTDYKAQTGRAAASWREVAERLRAARLNINEQGTPLDPSGAAYVLAEDGYDVDLGSHSEVPRK
ncbi:MAG: hypothetical protein H0T92_16320 [Pyrinomonadaceae bacterium]|jgi:Flp pilus assembly protein TadD|nr:hypothetical protein [Pyrinomonadaceae bacterium]